MSEYEVDQRKEMIMDNEMILWFSQKLSVVASKQRAKGKHGWWNEEVCSIEHLKKLLVDQLSRDELDVFDIGLLAGMIGYRQMRDKTKEIAARSKKIV